MPLNIEDRIAKLLDQLEDPTISAETVDLIERKLEVLRAQQT